MVIYCVLSCIPAGTLECLYQVVVLCVPARVPGYMCIATCSS